MFFKNNEENSDAICGSENSNRSIKAVKMDAVIIKKSSINIIHLGVFEIGSNMNCWLISANLVVLICFYIQ